MKNKIFKLLSKVAKLIGVSKLLTKLYKLTRDKTIELSQKDKVFGVFQDSFKNNLDLHTEIRSLIKPGWRAMFEAPKRTKPASKDQIHQKLLHWNSNLTGIENYLNAHSLSLKGKDVMEIGAYDGATAHAIAKFGANSVLGTDIAAYYIAQTPGGVITEEDIAVQNDKLSELRNTYAKFDKGDIASKVSFREDDICSSSIPSASKDVLVSWEVLEHITQPQKAFQEMARILKPGGIAFHEYNPFFSIFGGHSLCTLDFFWGHARLNSEDFERYITEIRPEEKDVALRFYHDSLNRMSLRSLEQYIKEAGLTPLNILPLISKEHLKHISSEVINQCKQIYPTIEIEDLVAPFVWVLFQKDQVSE